MDPALLQKVIEKVLAQMGLAAKDAKKGKFMPKQDKPAAVDGVEIAETEAPVGERLEADDTAGEPDGDEPSEDELALLLKK